MQILPSGHERPSPPAESSPLLPLQWLSPTSQSRTKKLALPPPQLQSSTTQNRAKNPPWQSPKNGLKNKLFCTAGVAQLYQASRGYIPLILFDKVMANELPQKPQTGPKCGHCQKLGHERHQCYELIGYPPGWQQRRTNRVYQGPNQGMLTEGSSNKVYQRQRAGAVASFAGKQGETKGGEGTSEGHQG
ncbi:hypothetical protein Cgig2_017538 [Carnegiea gigantea]|uniref:Uncharacterized protein n=1 Tax=Carnegiea gigantea TaxID=171969 RepID=A0A9Q1KKC4_9CARY|nr:hypothetical protein Cgig2_017538 [Carnegiea gigantea]